MGNFVKKDTWLGMAQLRHVEELAWWNGEVTRRELIEKFAISAQQASAIIQTYLDLNPKAMQYCLKLKRYLANPKMKCYFEQAELENELGKNEEEYTTISFPVKEVELKVKRYLMIAIRLKRIITIKYQSRSEPEAQYREIAPHAFGSDGVRLHVRSWCYNNKEYRDFSLLRIQSIKWPETNCDTESLPVDKDWFEWIDIKLQISSDLDKADQHALMEDFSLSSVDEVITIKSRKAMQSYALYQSGLEETGLPKQPFFKLAE